MEKDNLEFLNAKPQDKQFHSSRVMFLIKNGKVEVAPLGSTQSHIEWFESEGWAVRDNVKEFLEENVRGFYLPAENRLYCYKGVGFNFDDTVLPQIIKLGDELKNTLGLNDDTEIHLGPKDSVINGQKYPKFFAGILKDLVDG